MKKEHPPPLHRSGGQQVIVWLLLFENEVDEFGYAFNVAGWDLFEFPEDFLKALSLSLSDMPGH